MSKQWKIVDHPSIPGMIVIEGPAFRLVICAQAINITSSDYLQIMADARLIAAAPDMYELLTRVATSTNSGYGSMMSAAALADTLRDLSSQAKQLMAKIEGGGE
jgi:7-keto-8-aminopelargonate synthetase-like enzyme